MSKDRKYNYYVVTTWNKKTESRFEYYEDGYSAQEVVDRVRCYIADEEKIIDVYKQVKNWK